MDPAARRLLSLLAAVVALVVAWQLSTDRLEPASGRRAAELPTRSERDPPVEEIRKLDVQGHRGARALRPENTLVGFEHALRLGVTTLELDLGVTLDGAVVVAHDAYISPKICLWPDGSPIEQERGPLLRDLRLEQVKQFDCGSLNPDAERLPEPPRENEPGERIPTLDEVFDLVRQRSYRDVRFNIEIKTVPGSDQTIALEDFVATVVDVVRKYDMVDRTTIQAFDWRALEIADRLDSRLRMAALLVEETLSGEWNAGHSLGVGGSVVELLAQVDAKIDDFSPYWRHLVEDTPWLGDGVDDFRQAGMRVVPWTPNEEVEMQQLIDLGVDGIITDRPDVLLDLCRREGIEPGS